MSKIGEWNVQKSDGSWETIDLHELGTFDHDPLLVQLSDGSYGTPMLESLGDGDTGVVVQDSSGTWWQVARQGIRLMEDFENGVLRAAWDDSDYPHQVEVNQTAAMNGTTYGLEQDGFSEIHSYPFTEYELDSYPEQGQKITFRIQFRRLDANAMARFNFAKEDTSSTNEYELQMIPGSDSFRIQRDADNTKTTLASDTSVSYQTDTEYEVVIKWDTDDISDDFDCQIGPPGGTPIGSFTANDGSEMLPRSGTVDVGGVTLWVNVDTDVYWDEFYLE